jgi:hypothetical protein
MRLHILYVCLRSVPAALSLKVAWKVVLPQASQLRLDFSTLLPVRAINFAVNVASNVKPCTQWLCHDHTVSGGIHAHFTFSKICD